ncbi:MAG: hypothetical protein IH948_09955, partial [Bacteroidetes bacterium]|nr:hypothetical protein [Bacteroidota bacterium]
LDIHISGLPTLCNLKFEGEWEMERSTFLTLEMLKRGILGYRQFKPSYAHTNKEIDLYSKAIDEIFQKIANEKPDKLLSSPVAHSGFARLTSE